MRPLTGISRLARVLVAVGALLAALLAPLPAAADTVSASELLGVQNEYRFAIGAPTIPLSPQLALAAQRHADYSSANGVGGHAETPGLAGYSGADVWTRARAAGYVGGLVSEVATGGRDAVSAVRQLWDAPYHRLGMMHPNAIVSGWGHSELNGRGSTVGDFGYDFAVRPVDFVRSPAGGQTGLPTSWSGRESPSPLPAGVSGPVGYPIVLVYSGGQRVEMRAAEIVAPGGARLPIYYAPQVFESDYQVIVPQRPLPAGTTLHVRFDITVDGVWLTNEWDFTTAGAAAAQPVAAVPVAAVGTDGGYHSRWVSESPFPTLAPGETSAPLTVVFTNAGSRPWVRGVLGQQANLGINGDDRSFSTLGVGWPTPDRVAVQDQAVVLPGANGSFTFRVRAPAVPGLFAIHLRPVVDGTTWMEDEGVYLIVAVR